MTRRFRHIAALFALIALTALTVQGLWASTCLMGMESLTSAVSEEVPASPVSCSHGATGAFGQTGPSHGEGPSDASNCPFMPMNMAGSCGALLALPAESYLSLESSSPEARHLPWPNDARDLILAAAFFRPPIA